VRRVLTGSTAKEKKVFVVAYYLFFQIFFQQFIINILSNLVLNHTIQFGTEKLVKKIHR
jgi:hypothetical protein